MLCVLIVYISGGTYSFKSTPNDRFFDKLFIAILFTLRILARNLLRGNRRRNNYRISFWCLAWDMNSKKFYVLHFDITYLRDIVKKYSGWDDITQLCAYNRRTKWLQYLMFPPSYPICLPTAVVSEVPSKYCRFFATLRIRTLEENFLKTAEGYILCYTVFFKG